MLMGGRGGGGFLVKTHFWWLVRATYVVDGLFLGNFFWKVVGTVCIHVSHVQLPYTVINVWRINVWVEGHSCAATIHSN